MEIIFFEFLLNAFFVNDINGLRKKSDILKKHSEEIQKKLFPLEYEDVIEVLQEFANGKNPIYERKHRLIREENFSQLEENIDIKADDIESLADFALKNSVDLTIIGPEVPLSMGIVDLFQKKNLPIFGPMQYAAQLESSKAWAVEFMRSYK